MDRVEKKKIVSVNFNCTSFPLLSTCDDLVMQALVLVCMVQFTVIRFGGSGSALPM
jgi:hypothetical protein